LLWRPGSTTDELRTQQADSTMARTLRANKG